MTDLNSVMIIGRLTRDGELSYIPSGIAVCKFSIAVNRSKKVNDKWTDEASFFDCTLWGKMGESLGQYLLKGKQVAIAGELIQDRWEKDGEKRSRVNINVRNIQLLGGKTEGKEDPAARTPEKTTGFQDDIPW